MHEIALNWLEQRAVWGQADARKRIKEALGPASRSGMAYRWGVAVATGSRCEDWLQVVSRLACDSKPSQARSCDTLVEDIQAWLERIRSGSSLSLADATVSNAVAAAIPTLHKRLCDEELESVCKSLYTLHQESIARSDASDPLYLLLGAELGWHLHLLLNSEDSRPPLSPKLTQNSQRAMAQWCQHLDDSVPRAVEGGNQVRLVLASLIRCKKLGLVHGLDAEQKASWKAAGAKVAHWVMALSGYRGLSAFSEADANAVQDDSAVDGLLDQAIKFDREQLANAKISAVGKAPKGAGLSWEVSLPESMLHDPASKLSVMMPQWTARRSRMHVDYHAEQVRWELFGGKHPTLSGSIQSSLTIEDKVQRPIGSWQEVCEYSDDDVHYLEVEQDWTGGAVLQRQFMLIREDRCVFFSDAILPKDPDESLGEIRYQCRLPVAELNTVEVDQEIREFVFVKGNRRAMGIPLAAPEWKMGPSLFDLSLSSDQHLVLTGAGRDRVYVPLWFDFSQRRFSRKRTWRQLTVADQLKILDHSQAVGYRIQMGSEQWLVYRSLYGQRTRTVLGKHLMADFYCARFDAGDGSFEELITVDDNDE